MPLESKARWAKLKVGVMATVAMAILFLLVFLLTGKTNFFASRASIYTYFDDSASLTESSVVRLNGIIIGSVKKIELSGLKVPQRIVKLELEIEENMLRSIPVDSVASISASNLLGEKYINIKKGRAAVTVRPGAEIPSLDTREFDEVVQQGYAVMVSLAGIVKRVDAIVALVEVGKGSIGKLLVDEELYNRLLAIVAEAQKITAALSTNKGTIGKLLYDDAMYNQIHGSLGRMDSLLEGLQKGQGTAGKLLKDDAVYQDTHKAIVEVRQLLADLNAGKGTAGKLLKSDELHQQIVATLGRVDGVIDKVSSGQGTIGQLLNNPQLYDALNGTTREMQGLLKDFRANPKKFLRIKLGLF